MRAMTVNANQIQAAKRGILDRKDTIILEVVKHEGTGLATIIFDVYPIIKADPNRSVTVAEVKKKFRDVLGFAKVSDRSLDRTFITQVLRNKLKDTHWMAVVSMECSGKPFWRAVLAILENIENGTYKTS